MEWMAVIGDSIQYIEEHITDDITTDNIAKAVNVRIRISLAKAT